MRATVTPNAKATPLRRPDPMGVSSSARTNTCSVTPHKQAQHEHPAKCTVVTPGEQAVSQSPHYIQPTNASRQRNNASRNARNEDNRQKYHYSSADTATMLATGARPTSPVHCSLFQRPSRNKSIIRRRPLQSLSKRANTIADIADDEDTQQQILAMPVDRPLFPIPPPLPSQTLPTVRIIVHLIRHGESVGQLCQNPHQRRTDPGLRDCGLTERGRQQALQLRQRLRMTMTTAEESQPMENYFDMILSSPLTRALETALLVFGGGGGDDDDLGSSRSRHNINNEYRMYSDAQTVRSEVLPQRRHLNNSNKIIVNYDLREIGTCTIPENQPRPWSTVRSHLQHQGFLLRVDDETRTTIGGDDGSDALNTPSIIDDCNDCHMEGAHDDSLETKDSVLLDTETFAPTAYKWPDHHDITPRVVRRKQVQDVFRWLYYHYNSNDSATTGESTGLADDLIMSRDDGNTANADKAYHLTRHVAVVCHYHVIRAALRDGRGFCDPTIRPANAEPISCLLTPSGQMVPL